MHLNLSAALPCSKEVLIDFLSSGLAHEKIALPELNAEIIFNDLVLNAAIWQENGLWNGGGERFTLGSFHFYFLEVEDAPF